MKYAIIFAFAAFAILAQVNARSVVHESIDRGAIVQALKAKLQKTKAKLGQMIHDAQENLKVKIAEVKKQVEQLIDQLSDKVTEISDKVFLAAQRVLDKADKYEDMIVENAKKIIAKYGGSVENKTETPVTVAPVVPVDQEQ